jgi:nucleoside-diphosphate-sugar epimerase
MTKGEQEWSYLHAYDLASAFSKVIEDTNISGVVNVGNPSTIVIRDAALKIANILGKASLLEFGAIPYRNDQVMKLHPLCEKLTEAGWYPQISFDEGIRQTIEWLGRKNLTPIVTKNGQTIDFKLPVRQ